MSAAGKIFDREVLPRFEAAQPTWISQARAAAVRIATERGSVTINDVRDVCPPPSDADPRIMGSVFKGRGFTRTGFVDSDRPECHGRPIGVFALRQATA